MDRLILISPADDLKLPKLKNGSRREDLKPFTKDELVRIMATIKVSKVIQYKPYFYNLICLLANSGLRIGELIALEWKHIDMKNGKIRIRQGGKYDRDQRKMIIGSLKTEKSKRDIPFNKNISDALKSQKAIYSKNKLMLGRDYETEHDFVFTDAAGRILKPVNISGAWRYILGNNGIKHRGIHHLRHTFASIAISEGANIKHVSEILGHTSIKITYDVYAHLLPNDSQKVISVIERYLAGN